MSEPILLPRSRAMLIEQQAPRTLSAVAQTAEPTTTPGATPSQPIDRQKRLLNYAFWGDDNMFPETVIREIRRNEVLAAAIYWKAQAIISGGLVYGKVVIDENGNERLQRVIDPQVENWLKQTSIKRYLKEAAHEFYRFWNVFTEVIVSKDRSIITGIYCHESSHCRLQSQDDNGVIQNLYVSANWQYGDTEGSRDTLTIPLLDPYTDLTKQLRNGKRYKYALWQSGTDSGEIYYQFAPWHSLLKSHWLEVANEIATYKLSLLKNQIQPKYLVYVADEFWKVKFEGWDALEDEVQNKLRKQVRDDIDEKLAGTKNAGKVMQLTKSYNKHNGTDYRLIDIVPLDDKIKSGDWVEESQESVSHILFSQGLDGTLIGNTPGRTSFSGSDKRESFNIFITNSKPEQDIILEPLELVRDYNGWNPEYKFWFKNYYLQTLDAVAPAARKTSEA